VHQQRLPQSRLLQQQLPQQQLRHSSSNSLMRPRAWPAPAGHSNNAGDSLIRARRGQRP
jgi:hypothetical protein